MRSADHGKRLLASIIILILAATLAAEIWLPPPPLAESIYNYFHNQ